MTKILSEHDINNKITEVFNGDYFTIQKSRISPAEFDIVLLDRDSLSLINIEIKKNKWKTLIDQALRGLFYCHFSVAALPITIKEKLPLEEIEKLGIGLLFYEIKEDGFSISLEIEPKKSKVLNQNCKRLMYDLFVTKYGNNLYA